MANGLPDIIAGNLDVLFCGINPGMQAAATGHHFAGPSNRFWRVIHRAGFTQDEITADTDRTILSYGCGLTTVVGRPTARADEISRREFTAAGAEFERKVAHYAPRFVAFLGKAAYAALSGRPDVRWGPQSATIAGSAIWVLPNPSGRNRAFTCDRLVTAYRDLRVAAFESPPSFSR